MSRQARMTRTAISPRLAIRTLVTGTTTGNSSIARRPAPGAPAPSGRADVGDERVMVGGVAGARGDQLAALSAVGVMSRHEDVVQAHVRAGRLQGEAGIVRMQPPKGVDVAGIED